MIVDDEDGRLLGAYLSGMPCCLDLMSLPDSDPVPFEHCNKRQTGDSRMPATGKRPAAAIGIKPAKNVLPSPLYVWWKTMDVPETTCPYV